MILQEDKYVDYIDNLEVEVIDVWCRGLEDLMNDEDYYEAEGVSHKDYDELEEAYRNYIS